MSIVRKLNAPKFIMLSLSTACLLHVSGSETPEYKGAFEGKIFTEWYSVFAKSRTAAGMDTTLVSHGFENQRAYLGYRMDIDQRFSGRVLLDVGRVKGVTTISTIKDTIGDSVLVLKSLTTKTDDRLEAFLKAAYFELKTIPLTTLTFGMKGRNQFSIQEKFWGYRYIYKSFMDQEKYGSSADLGLGIKVKPTDLLELYADIENGEGYTKSQSDARYKCGIGVLVKPVDYLDVYVYSDVTPFEGVSKRAQVTAAGFIGIKPFKPLRIGVEYNFQKNTGGVETSDMNGISAYTIYKLKIIEVFARFDLVSHSTAVVDPYEFTKKTAILGIQWSPIKNLKISPNYQLTVPSGNNPLPVSKFLASGEFTF